MVEAKAWLRTRLSLLTQNEVEGTNKELQLSTKAPFVNARNDDGTPLLCIAACSDYESVQQLIEAGCLLNREDPVTKDTPLILAIKHKNFDAALLLIQSGCNVDKRGKHSNLPIHLAVQSGETRVIEALIKARCRVNSRNGDGFAPVHLAVICGDQEVFLMLMKTKVAVKDGGFFDELNNKPRHVVDLERTTLMEGDTPLHLASGVGNAFLVEHLLNKEVDIDRKNLNGRTALHCACEENRSIATIKLLLSRGADPNMTTRGAITPLHIAVINRSVDAVETLIEYNVDVNAKNSKNETALFDAVRANGENVLSVLLSLKQTDIHHTATLSNGSAKSALHNAVMSNCIESAKALLERGLNPNIGSCPLLRIAASHLNYDMVQLLIDYGAKLSISVLADNLSLNQNLLNDVLDDVEIYHVFVANGLKIDQKFLELARSRLESDDFYELLTDLDMEFALDSYKPKSLKACCRNKIQSILGDVLFRHKLTLLPIPQTLKKYISIY